MSENEYIHKSHHVPVMLYHFVCPAKYRRVVVSKEVDKTLKDTCPEIEKRYEIHFLEIGTDNNHVHFLIQSIPRMNPSQIVTIVKSVTARKVLRKNPEPSTNLAQNKKHVHNLMCKCLIVCVARRGNDPRTS
jgi:REP element-mobilizing transposase RayT